MDISPRQAVYIVDRLIRDGAVSSKHVAQLVGAMEQEIAELEARLARLRHDQPGAASKSARGAKRSQRPVRPEVAASRRLQGQYMGLMRHLGARDRARIKRLAAAEGREAAVRQMKKLVGES
jgi:hypothetical protein